VPRAPAAPSGGARLTRREREVVALIAQGHGNREIAERLFITEKTAEHHVSNILGKLGFTSRVQAAAYAVEQGLATAPAALAVS
jgi:DNA-binding NarL/FixJ family response regulator